MFNLFGTKFVRLFSGPICESVRQKWSGDVDLNDGKLDTAYQLYISSLQFVAGLGLKSRRGRNALVEDLKKILQIYLKIKILL